MSSSWHLLSTTLGHLPIMKQELRLTITSCKKSFLDVKIDLNEIVKQVYAMETSLNRSVFFCSGTTGKDLSGRSEGLLAAITFDRSLKVIHSRVLDDYNIQACTALRRFPKTDDLCVGCFKHMLIVTWTGSSFLVQNIVENVHTSKVKF